MTRQTSIEALASISTDEISRLQSSILAILGHHGPMTDEELIDVFTVADEAGEETKTDSDSSIRTRRAELVVLGRVIDTGQKRPSRSGRRMIVWGLKVVDPVRPEVFDPEDLPKSGMRPNSQPGRPDRYVNIEKAKAQASDQARIAERDRLRSLPFLDKPPRIVFGERLCRECNATGGNRLDGACWACGGRGVR